MFVIPIVSCVNLRKQPCFAHEFANEAFGWMFTKVGLNIILCKTMYGIVRGSKRRWSHIQTKTTFFINKPCQVNSL
jgi:hypothetical protein